MRKQNAFISSSSSSSQTYYSTSTSVYSYSGSSSWVTSWSQYLQNNSSTYSTMTQLYNSSNKTSTYSWNTYQSNAYQRIQYFLNIVEKVCQGYSPKNQYYQSLSNFDTTQNLSDDIWKGFIDIVITFPQKTRLAGIQLINPWIENSETSTYWKYLPIKFNIYKVNQGLNELAQQITYQNDIARTALPRITTQTSFKLISYNNRDITDNLTLLGKYSGINWYDRSSYKCFFRYNSSDQSSINSIGTSSVGTATWQCKQLVLRIFDTTISSQKINIIDQVANYIATQQNSYGTTYNSKQLDVDSAKSLIGCSNISAEDSLSQNYSSWIFGGTFKRSYNSLKTLKFRSGIQYKLGGIQPLLSPDIFSISEMKMYKYDGSATSKVYIGQWNSDQNRLIYYGTGLNKVSPYIDIKTGGMITWKHNLNTPAQYLDAKICIRFNMDYDTFKVGDVISNIMNANNSPISFKLTNNQISFNLDEGIGFTNPETGQFISFKGSYGLQMDRDGDYIALAAAQQVGANILQYGSNIAASVQGGCPCQVFFIVKRLF